MNYKRYNWSVFFRLIFFGGIVAALSITLEERIWLWVPVFSVLFILSVWNLIYVLNSTNRKIGFFFDSALNDDTTLHYPEQTKNKSLRALHQSMNRLNSRISEIKIRNEHNERFYLEIMKYSATGIIAVDNHGYVELINDSALNLLGLKYISHIDLLKQKNEELYHQLMKIRSGQYKTIKVLCGNELRLLSLRVSLLKFSDKKYRLYSLHDIRTELEENELDSWQKLIRVMTHEIMNSIGPITSLSNILYHIFVREGQAIPLAELSDKQIGNTIHGLEVIEQTSRGLMHFVEDYRKLTRIPKPDFKPIRIGIWLESIALLMKSRFTEEGIQFKLHIPDNQEELIGDEKLLTQVVINLIHNSIDALAKVNPKKISLAVNREGSGRFKITVTDNGIGIQPDALEKIFIPFYSTKETGSGIGLSLSRQIMRLHKGNISVFSEPEKQTMFVLNF